LNYFFCSIGTIIACSILVTAVLFSSLISTLVSIIFICLTIFVGVSLIFSVDELLSSKLKTRFFDRFVGTNESSESDDGDSLFLILIGDPTISFLGVITGA
jgi:hypothetical protein